jgi:hypothetical protein
MLEIAALGLAGRMDTKRDALDNVLRHAAEALYAEHQLHPRTRKPLRCMSLCCE